jgi:GNAT superfamily N-acetyltransferase
MTLSRCRHTGADALDDAPFRSLEALDLEAFGGEIVERLARQVVGREANGERFEKALEKSNRQQRASDVFEQEDVSARAEHTPCLRDRAARVGNRAEAERADDRVEALVRELECLRVAEAQIGIPPELVRPALSDREHLLAELDPDYRYFDGVVGQVSRRAGGELEHPALCSSANPLTAVPEKDALEEGDAPVVARCLAVLEATHSLRLGRDVAMSSRRLDGLHVGQRKGRGTELLFVHPAYAGRGIGRTLLAAAHDALCAAGCRETFLFTHEQNERALAVYAAAGYRLDGSVRTSNFRGTELRELRLVKQL